MAYLDVPDTNGKDILQKKKKKNHRFNFGQKCPFARNKIAAVFLEILYPKYFEAKYTNSKVILRKKKKKKKTST